MITICFRLLGFGDVRGYLEEMKEVRDGDGQKELMEKMQKGQFTLRDMYKQFQNSLRTGPMNKMMDMVPGMSEYLQAGDDEHKNRLKKYMYMMDSMTDAELDGKFDWHNKRGDNLTIESRIKRIARGSGTHPNEVKLLLQTHKQMGGMVSKMGKSGMLKGNKQQKQMMEAMKKNPAAAMSQLNKMNPQMVQQMGGRDAVMQMVSEHKNWPNSTYVVTKILIFYQYLSLDEEWWYARWHGRWYGRWHARCLYHDSDDAANGEWWRRRNARYVSNGADDGWRRRNA